MEPPIACSLDARAYAVRVDDLAALAAAALRSREPIPGGERLTFAPSAEPRVRDAIAAEAACCPFLRFALRRTDDALVVDVRGPDDALPVIAALFAASPESGGR